MFERKSFNQEYRQETKIEQDGGSFKFEEHEGEEDS